MPGNVFSSWYDFFGSIDNGEVDVLRDFLID